MHIISANCKVHVVKCLKLRNFLNSTRTSTHKSYQCFMNLLKFIVSICTGGGGGGGLMTTFGDLGNYVNGFTCSPHEI